jgi:hypothetical protein
MEGDVGAGLAAHEATLPLPPQDALHILGPRFQLGFEGHQIIDTGVRPNFRIIWEIQKIFSDLSIKEK